MYAQRFAGIFKEVNSLYVLCSQADYSAFVLGLESADLLLHMGRLLHIQGMVEPYLFSLEFYDAPLFRCLFYQEGSFFHGIDFQIHMYVLVSTVYMSQRPIRPYFNAIDGVRNQADMDPLPYRIESSCLVGADVPDLRLEELFSVADIISICRIA